MPLTEEAFSLIVDEHCTTGCSDPNCRDTRVSVEAIVLQKLPLLGGELYGSPSWGYKGEDLVRGTYRIACEGCQKELYTSTTCSRCNSEGGVARALETENAWPLPTKCLRCNSEQTTAHAFVPAVVLYEGKRANKARTQTAPEDPGFHSFRVECKQCRNVAERPGPCPICQ